MQYPLHQNHKAQGAQQGVQLLLFQPSGGAVHHAGVKLGVEVVGVLALGGEAHPDYPPVPRLAAPFQVTLAHQGVDCGGQRADPDGKGVGNRRYTCILCYTNKKILGPKVL